MTRAPFDPIATVAALTVLLSVALAPADAVVGVTLAACWLAVVPRPERAERARQ